MATTNIPSVWKFSCACSACQFECRGAPIGFVYCHCTDCRGHHEAILRAKNQNLTKDEIYSQVPPLAHIAHWSDAGVTVTKGFGNNANNQNCPSLVSRVHNPNASHKNIRYYCKECSTPLFYHAGKSAKIVGVNWVRCVEPELIGKERLDNTKNAKSNWKKWILHEPPLLIKAMNTTWTIWKKRPMHMMLDTIRDDLDIETVKKEAKEAIVTNNWNIWTGELTWTYLNYTIAAMCGFVKGRENGFGPEGENDTNEGVVEEDRKGK